MRSGGRPNADGLGVDSYGIVLRSGAAEDPIENNIATPSALRLLCPAIA